MSSTPPVATTLQVRTLMTHALAEGVLHKDAVQFDDLFENAFFFLWGRLPGKEDTIDDVTISSHIREVADDPKAKERWFALLVNKGLDVINPNRLPPTPGAAPVTLGHGIGAMSGDLMRAALVMSVLMKWLGISTLTITAGEDPAAIVASVNVDEAPAT